MKQDYIKIFGLSLLTTLLPLSVDAKVTSVEDYEWKGFEGAGSAPAGNTNPSVDNPCPTPQANTCETYGTEMIGNCRDIVYRRDTSADTFVYKNCTGDKGSTMNICDGSSLYPVEMSNKCDCPNGMTDVTVEASQNSALYGSNVTTVTYDGGSKICVTPATTESCDEYTKKPSDCYGVETTVCPSDSTKVSCADKPCAIGDIVYSDGRCYGDLPVPRVTSNQYSPRKMPVGVVVDPEAKLAVLPAKYRKKVSVYWQTSSDNEKAARMWADTCMNKDTGEGMYFGGPMYNSDFPQPEISGYSCSACGNCVSSPTLSFNWDISPLLQKVLSPLNNFTPIKSAHAADSRWFSLGCAIPYVATTQEDCISSGSFYTQKLMEFQNSNSNVSTEFKYAYESTDSSVYDIEFPAAEYCTGITGVTGKFESEGYSRVTPFLPSVAGLKQMLHTSNWHTIISSLINLEKKNSQSGNVTSDLTGCTGETLDSSCKLIFESRWGNDSSHHFRGFWSSQQAYSTNSDSTVTTWNKAMFVYTGDDNSVVVSTKDRSGQSYAHCFMNYQPGEDMQVYTPTTDPDIGSGLVSGPTSGLARPNF